MKKIFITVLCCLIILPAHAGMKKVMTTCMNTWIGYSFDDILNTWGRPISQEEDGDILRLYWKQSQSYVLGGPYFVEGGKSTCTRIVEIDSNDEIVGCRWEGISCPRTYFGVKGWVNPQNDPWKIKQEERHDTLMNYKIYKKYDELKHKFYSWKNSHKKPTCK